ncbi:hypothetical protein SAMN05421812_115104 [Asanoa hainanensis]|uniref:Uncharacterized protein n=1 Tax=Asanoa hainanensis TaxID=560556 RepID=A0A239P8T3_9ACTN|nr:hypothetical protein [Asanoa hainanensis]SNT63460.1 hypothetical protein SAMN05421812_115104 [Asanoa hainanensis]
MNREKALEARYRQLLWAYPKQYRRDRRAEIVGTLLDTAHTDQRRPTVREAATLAVRGLQTRAGTHDAPAADRGLRGALRLAALLMLAYATAGPLVDSGHIIPRIIADGALRYPYELVQPLVTVIVGCAVVAVAAGRYVWGLLAALGALTFTLAVLRFAISYDSATHDVVFPPFELTRDMAAEEPATWLLAFAALLILLALSLNGLDQPTWLWTLLIGTATLVTAGAVGLHRQAHI